MAKIAVCIKTKDLTAEVRGWLNEAFDDSDVFFFDSVDLMLHPPEESKPTLSIVPARAPEPVPEPASEPAPVTADPATPIAGDASAPPPEAVASAPAPAPAPVQASPFPTPAAAAPEQEAMGVPDLIIAEWGPGTGFENIQEARDRFRENAKFRVLILSGELAEDPGRKPALKIIDDWVVLPLDQSFFCQKVEALLAEKPSFSPSFLYRCPVEYDIEIAKAVEVTEVTELGVTIRNPMPLKPGEIGRLHVDWQGGKDLPLPLQSTRNERVSGENMVEIGFRYFGVGADPYREVRQILKAAKQAAGREKKKSAAPAPSAAAALMNDPCRIAIISMNGDTAAAVRGVLEDRLTPSNVTVFGSFGKFVANFEKKAEPPPAAEASAPAPEPAAEAKPAAKPDEKSAEEKPAEGKAPEAPLVLRDHPAAVCFDLTSDEQFFKFEAHAECPEPKSSELILGIPAREIAAAPGDLLGMIHEHDRAEWDEFKKALFSDSKPKSILRFCDEKKRTAYVEVSGSLVLKTDRVETSRARLLLKAATEERWKEQNGPVSGGKIQPFDLILLDVSCVEDPVRVCEKIKGPDFCVNVSDTAVSPRVVFVGTPEAADKIGRDASGVDGFLALPLDRRLSVQTVWQILRDRPLARQQVDFGGADLDIDGARVSKVAYISVEAKLIELSEFGMVLRFPRPFLAGASVRIYVDFIGEGLSMFAKCAGSEPEPELKGYHKSYFLFWSVQDESLKRIRTWIRQDYANKKVASEAN